MLIKIRDKDTLKSFQIEYLYLLNMSFIDQHTNDPLILCCIIVFIIAVMVQLYYALFIFYKLALYKVLKPNKSPELPISVIIAARNERKALDKNLCSILKQEYPKFEVIVVNNNSVDDSNEVLKAYQNNFKNLQIVSLNSPKHITKGKKLPLTLGIKAAKYEHLVFTDADCVPSSSQWLNKMAQKFEEGNEIVLGYGPYKKTKTLVNKIIRFDTAWIGINYFAFALKGTPYMGVGRNIAYTKTAYHQVNGFKSHYAIPSGDDDLFIQEASKKASLCIQIDSESFCESDAKETWSDWINQKSRHYTTSVRYRFIKKVMLATYPITLIAAWFSFVSLMILGSFPLLYTTAIVSATFIKWWIQRKCLDKIKEQKFALFFPIWDLFYALLIPIIYFLAKNKRNKDW